MDFAPADTQAMLADTVGTIVTRALEGVPFSVWESRGAAPPALQRELAAAGVHALGIPPDAGGVEADLLDTCAVVETLARTSLELGLGVAVPAAIARTLAHDGTTSGRELLPRIASGELLPTLAVPEACPPYTLDARTAPAMAFWRGDGPAVVALWGDPVELFRVPDDSVRAAIRRNVVGFRLMPHYRGLIGAPWGAALARIPARDAELRWWAPLLALSAVAAAGNAHAIVEGAVAYAGARRQFGKRIGDHQAIAHLLADMDTRASALRHLAYRAASAAAEGARDAYRLARQAKVLAATTVIDIANSSLQIHGGYGYTAEYPVERYLRDALTAAQAEGGPLRLARELGREAIGVA